MVSGVPLLLSNVLQADSHRGITQPRTITRPNTPTKTSLGMMSLTGARTTT
jgi:hypothetical protein